jgi:hypothetical protein
MPAVKGRKKLVDAAIAEVKPNETRASGSDRQVVGPIVL